jgi:hypothetical protein
MLKGADLTARMLCDERVDALGEILDACIGNTPPITLLKGISIADQYYPLPHLRPMSDLDLLVEEAAIPIVEAILAKLGYRQQSHIPWEFYDTHHHRMPFVHPRRCVWVEVHRGLFPPHTQLGMARVFGLEHLTRQLRPSTFRGRPVTRLSDALQIAYTAAHWASAFKGVGGVVAMADLLYLLRHTPEVIDWEAVFDWLEASVAAAHLYLLLTYLARYQLIDVPPERLRELSARQRSLNPVNLALMHQLIDRYIVAGPPTGRVCSDFHLDILWQTLLLPASPVANLLRAPWNLLMASRLGHVYAALPRLLCAWHSWLRKRPVA